MIRFPGPMCSCLSEVALCSLPDAWSTVEYFRSCHWVWLRFCRALALFCIGAPLNLFTCFSDLSIWSLVCSLEPKLDGASQSTVEAFYLRWFYSSTQAQWHISGASDRAAALVVEGDTGKTDARMLYSIHLISGVPTSVL